MNVSKNVLIQQYIDKHPTITHIQLYAAFPAEKKDMLRRIHNEWLAKAAAKTNPPKCPDRSDLLASDGEKPAETEITTAFLETELLTLYQDAGSDDKKWILRDMLDIWKTKHKVPPTEHDDEFDLAELMKTGSESQPLP